MQVLKPQALGLSTRPIEFRKRFGLSISAYLHLPFEQGERGTLWAEQSMWAFLAKEMAQPLIDEGVAKLTPEFLVHGHAFYPKDPAHAIPNACAVRARLGTQQKTLLVFGDRYWDGKKASPPKPFVSMPLGWQAAYGGPDFAANTVGRGRQAQEGVTWLPNCELPKDRLLRPDQTITPAGFGAFDVMHPQRAQHRGTYDADYLKLHSPGFAPDTDWRYFNLAPSDQWMPAALTGTETFAFENMHPDKPLVEGRLPGMLARVFAGYQMPHGEPKIREVPLRLTTVWFFPHALRCIAIFQGLAETDTDDGSDVVSLMGAIERNGEKKSDAHYLDAAAKRADPKMGAIYAIIDSDLLPDGASTSDPDVEAAKAPFAMEGLQGDAQYRRAEMDVQMARDKAVAMGRDPDALGIKMPPREKVPTGDALPPYLEKKFKEAEAAQWTAVEDAVTALEQAIAFADANKIDLAKVQHRGPPAYSAEQQLTQMQAQAAMGSKPIDLAPMYPKLCQIEDTHRAGYLKSAHMQPPAFAMTPEEAVPLRDEMARAVKAGIKMFAGINFTGADFSGLDLRGVNFSGAWLESVNFSKSNVSGADFSNAVLAHADLADVVAIGSNFTGANLGRATLKGGVFDKADFNGATLMHCCFSETQLRSANITGTTLMDTIWGQANWSGVNAAGQTFYKLDLRGMVLAEANLSGCNFIECNMSAVDFRGANLAQATFVTCKLDGALLQSAKAQGAVLVKDCTLVGANLSDANFATCNFGASEMTKVRMVKTMLDGANLSDAKANSSDWRLASVKGALLRKTAMKGALLAGANFQEAILQHADLRGADMRNCNLFAADMSRVRLDGDVQLDGALLKRARTWPRLTPEQQAKAR